MYFDINTKEKEEDFFNYKEEKEKLNYLINNKEKLIIIKGLRRVGKTSLMKIIFNKINSPKVFLDGREYKDAKELFRDAFKDLFRQINPLEIVLENLSSVDLGPIELNLNKKKEIFKEHVFIFIDEAQEVERIGPLLAHYYDNYRNISFIISGSEVGIMDSLFSPEASLFGRLREEIFLQPLKKEKSKEFLRIGFAQIGKEFKEEEIDSAVNELDGLIGWLTYYGYLRLRMDHKNAIDRVKKDARFLLSLELKKFLEKQRGKKERFLNIIKSLKNPLTWENLKLILESKEGKISSSRLSFYLRKLIDYGFIVKENSLYKLADPLLKYL